MFGKKNRGPTSEELISNLKYKMDIVEMLMEKSEKEHSDNFTELRDMIHSQEERSNESIRKIDEQLQSIKDMLDCIQNDVDVNLKKMNDVDTKMNLEICEIRANLTKSVKTTDEIQKCVTNFERQVQENISIVKQNFDEKIDFVG